MYREPMRSLVSPAECTAVVTRKDASESAVTVRCTTPGVFAVELLPDQALFFLLFTADGSCPTIVRDGGATDATDGELEAGVDGASDAAAE